MVLKRPFFSHTGRDLALNVHCSRLLVDKSLYVSMLKIILKGFREKIVYFSLQEDVGVLYGELKIKQRAKYRKSCNFTIVHQT